MANPKLAVLEKDLGSIENGVINQGKVGSLTGWRGAAAAADSGAAVAASAPCCFGGGTRPTDRGKLSFDSSQDFIVGDWRGGRV